MKRPVATAVAGALAAVALGTATAPPARADGPPGAGPGVGAPYCSPSGDLCFEIVVRRGSVFLELTTFARYFARHRLCVRDPAGGSTCRAFSVTRRGQVYGSSVRWNDHFPSRGRGTYEVRWLLGSRALGPTLRFTLPLRR